MDKTEVQERAGGKPIRKLTPKLALIFLALAAIIFVPAGTWDYWQGWVFFASILALATAVLIYLVKNAPGLLERRLQAREREAPQKLILKLGSICAAALIVLPGLDRRWGWSRVPPAVVLAADAVFLWAYLYIFRVFRVNSYASRTVEVVPGQTVITTGPYALVRHPMYLGMLVMYLAMPLALGSFWALLAYPPLPFIFAFRISNEEEVLTRDLAGYEEYREKVRFKVLPRIW